MAITLNSSWREEHITLNAGETRTLYFTDKIKPNTFIFMGATGQIKVGTDRPVSLSYSEMTIKSETTQIFAKPMAVNSLYIGNFNSGSVTVLLYYALADFDPSWLKTENGSGGGGSVELTKPLPSGTNQIGAVQLRNNKGKSYGDVAVVEPLPTGSNTIGKVDVNSSSSDPIMVQIANTATDNYIGIVKVAGDVGSGPVEVTIVDNPMTNKHGQITVADPLPSGANIIGKVTLTDSTGMIGHVKVNTIPSMDSLPHFRQCSKGTMVKGSNFTFPTTVTYTNNSYWYLNRFYIKFSGNLPMTKHPSISIPTVSGQYNVSALTSAMHMEYGHTNDPEYSQYYETQQLCYFNSNGVLQHSVTGDITINTGNLTADSDYVVILDYVRVV